MISRKGIAYKTAAFIVPYLAAVVAATGFLFFALQLWSLFTTGRWETINSALLGILMLVSLGIALFALVPMAAMVVLRERAGKSSSLTHYAISGAAIGGAEMAIFLYVTTNMNLLDQWMWRSIVERLHFVPVFAAAGLIGGGIFGFVRTRMI